MRHRDAEAGLETNYDALGRATHPQARHRWCSACDGLRQNTDACFGPWASCRFPEVGLDNLADRAKTP